MALQRTWIPSSNYSGRGGAKVRLLVLHTAEGAKTYQSLGNYFAQPSSGVSSHVGIDDTPGVIGEYVKTPNKAWTAANANPVAVQAELCAFAKWSTAEWDTHPTMLQNAAQWLSEESKRFGVPLVRLSASQAQGGSQGVCQHVDLGAWGGNHWDCGPGFPMDRVINMAKGQPTAPAPKPKEDDCPMIIATATNGGMWLIWGSFRTQIKNPSWVETYKQAGAKQVNWSQEMIDRFPLAGNTVK